MRYAFSRDGLPFTEPLPARRLIDSGLAPNHWYSYRVRAEDSSPWRNATDPSQRAAAACTWVEAPAAISVLGVTARSVAVSVDGPLSGLGEERTSLRVLRGEPPIPATPWRAERSLVIGDLQPNERVRLSAQARNRAGVVTPSSAVLEIATLAVAPPTPRVTLLATFGPLARLSAGDNTAGTWLALGERRKSLWLTPSGNVQTTPYFAPQSAWRDVPLHRLQPGTAMVFAVARNAALIHSPPSPALMIEIAAPGLEPASGRGLEAPAAPGEPRSGRAGSREPESAPPPVPVTLTLAASWREDGLRLDGSLGGGQGASWSYRFERDGAAISRWQSDSHLVDHGAPSNSIVRYRLLARSPAATAASLWLTIVTPIEPPAGLDVDAIGQARIAGKFSHLDAGTSGLQARFLQHGAELDRTEFARQREIARPGVAFDAVELRARNQVAAETEWILVPREVVARWRHPAGVTASEPAAAAPPPAPLAAPAAELAKVQSLIEPARVELEPRQPEAPPAPCVTAAAAAMRVVIVGVDPEATVCLYDTVQSVYLSAQGEASATPVFLLPSRWQEVRLRNLGALPCCVLRARARNAAGELSAFGPPLEIGADGKCLTDPRPPDAP
ncbi:MAG: hypothetical protein U1E76_15380 [Planctomycetota bacterium]